MEGAVNSISKKQIIVIAGPTVCGVLFVLSAYLEALVSEFLLFLCGVLVSIVQIPFVINWCIKKRIKLVLCCITSTVVFFGLILFGRYFDETLFYAT